MSKDPYRYFRIEAQELLQGLGEGLLKLETDADPELFRRLLRQAHTLKGASRVVKRTDIGDLAHQIEDVLSAIEGGGEKREAIDRALGFCDRIRQLVANLDRPAVDAPATSVPDAQEEQQTIRIEVRDVDALLESAFEAHAAASSLRGEGERLAQVAADVRDLLADLDSAGSQRQRENLEQLVDDLDSGRRALVEHIDRVTSDVSELRAVASELRLVPAQTLMNDLERVARDAARTLDKDVAFRASGSDTHVDAHLLAGLRKALVHIVRNSVAHGIEARAERAKAGKPAVGQIDIFVERRGHRVSISCRDDGRGLDLPSVKAAAVARGLVTAEAARSMDPSAIGRMLLRGGVSTSRAVTGISGRGVGLDAVRHAVEALKGEVRLSSTAGQGTTVDIDVPISLSTIPALLMQVDDVPMLMPLDSVRHALRLAPDDISRDAEGERVVVEGNVIPFVPLRRALRRPARERSTLQSAVVIEAEGRRVAIGVDRLSGARSIVVHAIPAHAAADPIISGAALDESGVPQLVLAPAALVRAAARPAPPEVVVAVEEALPLLIVDDSLTTRMLEQSILESAGYAVDLAVSGEDALEKARAKRYGVFIVDVEMPGMNGFEFIETTRRDAELRNTPAILVTSRSDPEDKRRGKQAGARAYIVKSEFDQADLLATIRSLVG